MKTKAILIASAAVLVVASAALAGEAFDSHRDRMFSHLDANGDGVVSKTEFDQGHARFGGPGGPGHHHHRAGAFFVYSADADRNREVTQTEWDAFVNRALGTDGRLSAEELTALFPERSRDERPHRAEHIARFLEHLDRDGNDAVDAADFNAIFEQLDEDGNGTLETGEFGHRHPRGHRGPRR